MVKAVDTNAVAGVHAIYQINPPFSINKEFNTNTFWSGNFTIFELTLHTSPERQAFCPCTTYAVGGQGFLNFKILKMNS